jgi:hypothetical protein
MNPSHSEVVALAQQDLAERLGIASDQVEKQIEVREMRAVTWPDASLGCPQPGMLYAQVAQAGLLIRLSVGGEIYYYHSGEAQEPIFCEEMAIIDPNATPRNDELMPPPGREID